MVSYFAIYAIVKFRLKEFFTEYNYTILSPLIYNFLFIIIFSTIDRYYSLSINNISFIEFLIPGLILIIVAQESFDSSSASIINSKQIGSFNDFLMAPLSRIELYISYLISQIIISIFLSFINFYLLSFFVELKVVSFFYFIYYVSLVSIFFSSLGCFVGFISFNWDSQSSVSNFFVIPINFLSGTFFSINNLPENLKFIFIYNPYYYIVSFFRNTFNLNFEFKIQENFFIILFVSFMPIFTGFVFYKGYKVIK